MPAQGRGDDGGQADLLPSDPHAYAGLPFEELLPGVDYLAYFHRAPLVWSEADGTGVMVAVDGPYGQAVQSLAPGAKVVDASLPKHGTQAEVDTALEALRERGVRALSSYDPDTVRTIVGGAIERSLAVVVGLAPETPGDSALVADLDQAGAIIAGPLAWTGEVLLTHGDSLPVTIYASAGGFPGDRVDYATGAVLGAVTLEAERSDSEGAEWPQGVKAALSSCPETWVNSDLGTGKWTRAKFVVDPETGEYTNQGGYAFRLLDVPALFGRGPEYRLQWPSDELAGLQSLHDAGITGQGVTVAIIDAGFFPGAPDISDSIVGTEAFGADDFSELGGFHGTTMGSMVLAYAPDAELVLLGVGSDQPGTTDTLEALRMSLVEAVNRAVELKVDVITMSFKPYLYKTELREALEKAADAGIVVAACNSRVKADGVIVPEALEAPYYHISYGTADQVPDLWVSDRWPDYGYPADLWQGNSNTSPQVAGMAALILQARPGLSPADVEDLLKSTALETDDGRLVPRVGEAIEGSR